MTYDKNTLQMLFILNPYEFLIISFLSYNSIEQHDLIIGIWKTGLWFQMIVYLKVFEQLYKRTIALCYWNIKTNVLLWACVIGIGLFMEAWKPVLLTATAY